MNSHFRQGWRFQVSLPRGLGGLALAEDMYDEVGVHTCMVSFVADGSWVQNVLSGDGFFVRTNYAEELVTILDDISQALPMALAR